MSMHPLNLLRFGALKEKLERFIAHVSQKRERGQLRIMTMGSFTSYLNNMSGGQSNAY